MRWWLLLLLFVGDDWERDIEGALGAGLGAIWLDRERRPLDSIAGGPLATRVSSLCEIFAHDELKDHWRRNPI